MIDKLIAYLKELVHNRFYGRVVLHFEAGKVVHINEEKSIKLSK